MCSSQKDPEIADDNNSYATSLTMTTSDKNKHQRDEKMLFNEIHSYRK